MKTHGMAFVGMVTLTLVAQSATFTWNGSGGDNNWTTAANWSGGVAPASDGTSVLAFGGMTRPKPVNTFAADTVFAGINLLNDQSSGKTAAFTLSGNRVVLGGNIVAATASASLTDTLSLPIVLNGTRTITANNNHHLSLTGVISESGGAQGLTKAGGGTLTLNGANTYSGPTTVNGGTVRFNTIKDIGAGASSFGAPVTPENAVISLATRIEYTGGTTATDRPLALTGNASFDVSTTGVTLTLNGDITSTDRNIMFRGAGDFLVNGKIDLGSGRVSRTDAGTLYLTHPESTFSGRLQVAHGTISVAEIADSGIASPIGAGDTIMLGQNGWNTTGRFRFTGATGGACNRTILVETTVNTFTYGGIIENAVAGQMLTLSGPVSPGPDSVTRDPILHLAGAGDGELSGVISGRLKVEKDEGSGTWILSGANTYSGATLVMAGALLINGSTHADSAVSVGSGGTLGGTGTVHAAVTVAAGGTLAPGSGGVGTLTLADTGAAALTLNGSRLACDLSDTASLCDRIDVAGTLVLEGANILSLSCPPSGAPSGVYTVMTYVATSGSGSLALDRAYPNTTLGMDGTHVYLTVTGAGAVDSLVWAGDGVANVWDTSTPNWSAGPYGDNMRVVFDDTGSDSPEVNITPAAVAPHSVIVDTAVRSYTIGGAGIAGTCGLTKTGAAGLTLAGTHAYTGVTDVQAGSLTLSGELNGSSLTIANGAAFNQTASGTIAGEAVSVTSVGTATLSGANTYGGETVVGVVGITNITLTVAHNQALGSTAGGTRVIGGATANFNNSLVLADGVTVSGETLTLQSGSGRARLSYAAGSGSATWAGDIVLDGGWNYLSCDRSGSTLFVGASAENIVSGVNRGISVRGGGTVVINSTIQTGSGGFIRDDPGICVLNAADHQFGSLSVVQGTFRLGAANVIPRNILVTVGKSGYTADAVLDLNGYDQCLAGVADAHLATGNGTQRIVSSTPATLTVSNETARSFGKVGSAIEGAITLVKLGSGTFTLTSVNSYSGATVVSNGTLAVSAGGSLGANALQIEVGGTGTLSLSTSDALSNQAVVSMPAFNVDSAKIHLDEGVEQTVGWLIYDGKFKSVGTYGATGSGADRIDDTHFSGSGRLRVLSSKSGLIMSLR